MPLSRKRHLNILNYDKSVEIKQFLCFDMKSLIIECNIECYFVVYKYSGGILVINELY